MYSSAVALPMTALESQADWLPADNVTGPRRLPRIELIQRSGPILQPNPMADQADVLSLNLARGCVHQCAFCTVRAGSTYRGNEVVGLFEDTASDLEAELRKRRKLPRAVYISPSTDPFPPLSDMQAQASRVVEVLAAHGIEAWLMTRGYIRPSALRVLQAHREHVKVTIGLTTLDRKLQRVLEPLAAPPKLRLRQIGQLRDLGIPVQVSMEPLVPALTDTRENLAAVLEALAAVGVRQVTAGYMFLRSGIRDNLIRALEPLGWAEPVLKAFMGGPLLASGPIAPARYLPKARRQRGYASIMALAAGLGMTVRVCGTTNPDFQVPRREETDRTQRPLFSRFLEAHAG